MQPQGGLAEADKKYYKIVSFLASNMWKTCGKDVGSMMQQCFEQHNHSRHGSRNARKYKGFRAHEVRNGDNTRHTEVFHMALLKIEDIFLPAYARNGQNDLLRAGVLSGTRAGSAGGADSA
jgi:hypothetical protein